MQFSGVPVIKEPHLGRSLGSVCDLLYPLVVAIAQKERAGKAGLYEVLLPVEPFIDRKLSLLNPWRRTVRSSQRRETLRSLFKEMEFNCFAPFKGGWLVFCCCRFNYKTVLSQ